ncbi:MAG TPA: hypothetical protein VGK16_02240 [Candidatus Limnocylindrales bacterium]|jgi:hypothetical protein
MTRLAPIMLLLVATLAACGSTPANPSQPVASPSSPVIGGSPSASPQAASPDPTDGPSPSTPGPVLTPEPDGSPEAAALTVEEQYLLDGVRAGATDCRPLRANLPTRTTGAIECGWDDPSVARVGFFLFDGEVDMLAAYYARMDAEGVKRNSVACVDGAGESPYTPGGDTVASRQGCFVNDAGYANYRATIPAYLLYVGVLGRTGDMAALANFAWRGNEDVPGMPTLWAEPAN